ncbi:MAG: hypothetical protein K0A90_05600, partial [Methanosarcinaceae archaeon]|nr:hypothetical protein [Methanosarcinaceae archaeon]
IFKNAKIFRLCNFGFAISQDATAVRIKKDALNGYRASFTFISSVFADHVLWIKEVAKGNLGKSLISLLSAVMHS